MDNPTRRTLTRLEKGFHAVVAVCITTALFVLERLTEPMTSGGSVEGHFIFLAGTMGLVSASLWIYSLWSRRRQKVIREASAALIRKDIDRGRLVMAYQPILDMDSGEVVSCEALLRVLDNENKPMAPARFLVEVEEHGLQAYLSRAIVRMVEVDYREHRLSLPVTVNLSLADIGDDDLITLLLVPRSFALNIEVTETAFLGATPHALQTLDRLRGRGVKIYLDDFGTGYSSFTHLAEMPIDVLKIDREFIRKSQLSPKHAAICKTIVDLTRTIDVASVAEGVETVEEQRFLRGIGCDRIQGYLYHRPMTASALASVLSDAPRMPVPQSKPWAVHAPGPSLTAHATAIHPMPTRTLAEHLAN
ncbi:EAL domain-containing protein [Paramagnetospirillum magneticum]|uniref:Predicted signal transduction protein containing sensor and EAL domains n=1 Tax=Paramagnetospirillum magneticum (strain ATCC 700264 / AMB-1) TaxID=342108 RepID=Q2W221_PARM1|nr:EAL domain-containing protein [Paramagnetospirillum magneticum]BAE52104.1 Predicted signal transduction protein containing sensor and EAL domains [Paramagnetospirillum magneticum AMB-1]